MKPAGFLFASLILFAPALAGADTLCLIDGSRVECKIVKRTAKGIFYRRGEGDVEFASSSLVAAVEINENYGQAPKGPEAEPPAAGEDAGSKGKAEEKAPVATAEALVPKLGEGEEKRLLALIEGLGNTNRAERAQAQDSVAAYGLPATPYLVKAMKEKGNNLRAMGGAEALGAMGDKARNCVWALLARLLDANGDGKGPLSQEAASFAYEVSRALTGITGQDFGYVPFGFISSPEARTGALDKWKKWWEENSKDYPPQLDMERKKTSDNAAPPAQTAAETK